MMDRYTRMTRKELDEELRQRCTTTEAKIHWVRAGHLTRTDLQSVLRRLDQSRAK